MSAGPSLSYFVDELEVQPYYPFRRGVRARRQVTAFRIFSRSPRMSPVGRNSADRGQVSRCTLDDAVPRPRNVRAGRESSRAYTKPRVLGGGRPGLGSGLGGERSRTQLLQQVMCQRRTKSPHFEPRASNSQEAARSDCRFRSPYLDATEQTMSDRSDSDFIQRPSSTHSRQSRLPIADGQRSKLAGIQKNGSRRATGAAIET